MSALDEKIGNVKVVCRFRPLNEREKAMGNVVAHELVSEKTVNMKSEKSNVEPLQFSFDKVFDCDSTQKEVYNYAAASVIDSVIEGFNGTIFAYGQTSSGKTHTMEGEIGEALAENSGIIPRMVEQVFESISKSSENVEFRIKVSMVELYMEKLRDLIDTQKSDLKIRSDKKKGIFIENLTETYISSSEEVYKLMEVARGSRAIAATNMNERSSRSHMLFILTISQNNIDDLSAKTGKLYLVDLAGSEKVGKTGAEGKVLDEAKKINISLTALGKVIYALTDGKSTHVPYRDSKLTRVLQQSLGGNSKTSLIVTCSPHPNNFSQTISTLRFGVSAKKIKNKPKINKQLTVAQLQNLLQKAERDLIQRQKYIDQLKNYILTDLKQKSIPVFSNENKITSVEQQQTDLIGELQRQLEIERNLNLVQQQELTNLKQKYEKIAAEKEILQNQIALKQQATSTQMTPLTPLTQITPLTPLTPHKQRITPSKQYKQREQENQILSIAQVLTELRLITNDEKVLNFFQQKKQLNLLSKGQPEDYQKLMSDYELQKQKRQQSEDKMIKYEKTMQKKLSQLENNICQLTHAYYDLLIIQQRHKVDNIFLKKKLEEKDNSIVAFKDRIRDLEDQNRDLEEQQWGEYEDAKERKPLSKYSITEEQQTKLHELCEKRGSNNTNTSTKVVKVLRGGNK